MKNNNGFKKGREKTGGRRKGTLNRTTAETRAAVNRIMAIAADELETKIKDLSAKELVDLISKFSPYLIVKKNEMGMLGDNF